MESRGQWFALSSPQIDARAGCASARHQVSISSGRTSQRALIARRITEKSLCLGSSISRDPLVAFLQSLLGFLWMDAPAIGIDQFGGYRSLTLGHAHTRIAESLN